MSLFRNSGSRPCGSRHERGFGTEDNRENCKLLVFALGVGRCRDLPRFIYRRSDLQELRYVLGNEGQGEDDIIRTAEEGLMHQRNRQTKFQLIS